MTNIELVRRALAQLYPTPSSQINQVKVAKFLNANGAPALTRLQIDNAMQLLRKRGLVLYTGSAWFTRDPDAKKPPVPNTAAENGRLKTQVAELEGRLTAETAARLNAQGICEMIRDMRAADRRAHAHCMETQRTELLAKFGAHILGLKL